MRYSGTIRIVALVAASTMQILYGQIDTGSISGTVRDSSGAVVQSAKVVITEIETGILVALLSNSDGFYSAPTLRIGKYEISAYAAGFATETQKHIELQVQDRLNIDF